MRLFILIIFLISTPIWAQDCDWSSEADGDVPVVDSTGAFNLISCPGNLTISGNFDFNNLAGLDPDKPGMIDVSGDMNLLTGVVLSLNGGNGGNGNGTGSTSGGIANLSGSSGGSIVFFAAEDGFGFPKQTPSGIGSGKRGLDGIGVAPGSGGGGANFLTATAGAGTSTGVAGGASGPVVASTEFNFGALFLGGNGGGAGGQGNNSNDDGGAGGAGGGALKLTIQGTLSLAAGAKITANGGSGGAGLNFGAGGGGGSGGAIYIVTNNDVVLDSGAGTSIEALGGSAGAGGATGVAGGTGGQGVIRIEFGGEIIGGGAISPTPTLVDTNTTSVQQQLEKFSSDISCAVIPRQKVPATFWQIILGFGLALVLIKRKKTTNF